LTAISGSGGNSPGTHGSADIGVAAAQFLGNDFDRIEHEAPQVSISCVRAFSRRTRDGKYSRMVARLLIKVKLRELFDAGADGR
jgi:hypothetical protein